MLCRSLVIFLLFFIGYQNTLMWFDVACVHGLPTINHKLLIDFRNVDRNIWHVARLSKSWNACKRILFFTLFTCPVTFCVIGLQYPTKGAFIYFSIDTNRMYLEFGVSEKTKGISSSNQFFIKIKR